MSITITGEQRDALYGHLVARLGGIDDIAVAIEARNFGLAERIGREYVDELRFLLDDVGLSERGTEELVELSSPPDLLRRVLPRLRGSAQTYAERLESETVEAGEMRWRGKCISEACASVLDAIGEAGTAAEGRAPTEAPRMSRWRRVLPRAR